MTRLNDIIYKNEVCNKGLHKHSHAKHTLGRKQIEIWKIKETQNIINEPHRRWEVCTIGLHKKSFSKHLKVIKHFGKKPALEQEPETEAQL